MYEKALTLLYTETQIEQTVTTPVVEFNLVSPNATPGIDIKEFHKKLCDSIKSGPHSDEEKFVTEQMKDILQEYWNKKYKKDLNIEVNSRGRIHKKGDRIDTKMDIPNLYTFFYFISPGMDPSPLILKDSETTVYPAEGYGIMFPSWMNYEFREQVVDSDVYYITGTIKLIN